MSLCLACPICSENYTNSDNIYSTQCGHVFHSNCIQQELNRSSRCPICRVANPQTHKIYLDLENSAENEKKLIEIKLELEISKKRISELEQQEQQVEKVVEINSQLEQYIKTSSELQQQLEETERNFMNLQAQYNKKEDKIKYLSVQLEYRIKEKEHLQIENLALRNESLKSTTNISNISTNQAEIALRERINTLEEKLKQVSLELDKEIRNSTDLTVEKMKLQSILSQYSSGAITAPSNFSNRHQPPQNYYNNNNTLMEPIVRGNPKINARESLIHSSIHSTQNIRNYNLPLERENSKTYANEFPVSSINSSIHPTQNRNYAHMNMSLTHEITNDMQNQHGKNTEIRSVVIRGIERNTEIPFISTVLRLAHQMGLQLTENDIENVSPLERKHFTRFNIQPDKISLVVKFKTLGLKIKFLSNKDKLKNNPETKNMILYEFVNENTNVLFHYAKILKTNGYKSVFCKNNIVYVKKHQNSPAIQIKTEEDVDKMMANATENYLVGPMISPTFDEYLY